MPSLLYRREGKRYVALDRDAAHHVLERLVPRADGDSMPAFVLSTIEARAAGRSSPPHGEGFRAHGRLQYALQCQRR